MILHPCHSDYHPYQNPNSVLSLNRMRDKLLPVWEWESSRDQSPTHMKLWLTCMIAAAALLYSLQLRHYARMVDLLHLNMISTYIYLCVCVSSRKWWKSAEPLHPWSNRGLLRKTTGGPCQTRQSPCNSRLEARPPACQTNQILATSWKWLSWIALDPSTAWLSWYDKTVWDPKSQVSSMQSSPWIINPDTISAFWINRRV